MAQIFLKFENCCKGSCYQSQEPPWYCSESKRSKSLSDGAKPTGSDIQGWLHDESHLDLIWLMRRGRLLAGVFQTCRCLHFSINSVFPGEGITAQRAGGGLAHSFHSIKGFLLPSPRPSPGRDTETGYLTSLLDPMDICLSRTFELTLSKDALQVLSLFSLFLSRYVHPAS